MRDVRPAEEIVSPRSPTAVCPARVLVDTLVVVMPAYDESEGIGDFLRDLDDALSGLAHDLTFIVVDDASPVPLETALRFVAPSLRARTEVLRSDVNRGHGPTALSAYRHGLRHRPDVLVHVDGDGQIAGSDVARLVAAAVVDGTQVVTGVRRRRVDPWFRRLISAVLGRLCRGSVSSPRDVNSPFRAYDPEALGHLLASTPAEALVPHVHFSRAAHTHHLVTSVVEVEHRARRGSDATGTTWRGVGARFRLPSLRLVTFCLRAGWEVTTRRPTGSTGEQPAAATTLTEPATVVLARG